MNRESFKNQLNFYNERYFEGPRDLSLRRIINTVSLLGNVHGKTILDIGCGTGEGSRVLRQRGANTICVDIAPYAVQTCHIKEHCQATIAIAHNLPFHTNSVDGILFMDVIEHIPTEFIFPTLREIRRVAKPHSRIAIHTMPNLFLEKLSSLYGIFNRMHWRRWGVAGGHINTYTSWRLHHELETAGFTILSFIIGRYPSDAPFSRVLTPLSRLLPSYLGNDFWVCCKPKKPAQNTSRT